MINLAAAEYKALFSETAYGDDGNYLGGKVPGRDGGFGHGSALLQSNAALRLMDAQRPRGDGSASSAPERRPLVQENWHHYGREPAEVFEAPIFTDAWIIGQVTEGYGPYQFFNTVPGSNQFHVARPAIVLRFDFHVKYELPSWDVTSAETYHAGSLEDEVASLLSLCMGIRAQAGDINRPRGQPIEYSGAGLAPTLPPPGRAPIVPAALGQHSLEQLAPLRSLPRLPAKTAIALVRSARLYQAALWVCETDPNQSWVLLTSAIETAAGSWDERANSPLDTLRGWHPSLVKLLMKRGGEDLASEVAEKLKKISGSTWKFVQFLERFRPDPPAQRPPAFCHLDWSQPAFGAAMNKVYAYRSGALHGGTPFPSPMCQRPMTFGDAHVLAETSVGSAGTGVHNWKKGDLPVMLHLFEYIVRHALLNWWTSCDVGTPADPAPPDVGEVGSGG